MAQGFLNRKDHELIRLGKNSLYWFWLFPHLLVLVVSPHCNFHLILIHSSCYVFSFDTITPSNVVAYSTHVIIYARIIGIPFASLESSVMFLSCRNIKWQTFQECY